MKKNLIPLVCGILVAIFSYHYPGILKWCQNKFIKKQEQQHIEIKKDSKLSIYKDEQATKSNIDDSSVDIDPQIKNNNNSGNPFKPFQSDIQEKDFFKIYDESPKNICANHCLEVDIWSTQKSLEIWECNQNIWKKNKKSIQLGESIKLSDDCCLILKEIKEENYVPGRTRRLFAVFEQKTQ